ncbi:MAG: hypothetical protein V4574_06425 [Pseudomonadota bacterium]
MRSLALLCVASSLILSQPVSQAFASPTFGTVCSDIDAEQTAINRLWYSLTEDYPITTSVLKSCVRNASDNDAVGKCMATALVMAQICPTDHCDTNAIDFSTRMTTIGVRASNLSSRKSSASWCTFYVDDAVD